MKKKQIKIGIVGHGFVGKATDYGFDKNVEKFIVDPLLNTNISDLSKFNPEIIFICVPTPMRGDGSQDSNIIRRVMKELSLKCPEAIKVVKSTVLPNILEELYSLESRMIYNPEFLRENHANEDFINSSIIIFGGEKVLSNIVSDAYIHHSKCISKDHIFTDLVSASLIKYCINTFLASKVSFFNEMFQIYEKLNVNDSWKSLIDIISRDQRIGSSHMDVPGHDGKKGFGGACFPKDTVAFVKYAEQKGSEMMILRSVIKSNNEIRSQYREIGKREEEQNISFDDKI